MDVVPEVAADEPHDVVKIVFIHVGKCRQSALEGLINDGGSDFT